MPATSSNGRESTTTSRVLQCTPHAPARALAESQVRRTQCLHSACIQYEGKGTEAVHLRVICSDTTHRSGSLAVNMKGMVVCITCLPLFPRSAVLAALLHSCPPRRAAHRTGVYCARWRLLGIVYHIAESKVSARLTARGVLSDTAASSLCSEREPHLNQEKILGIVGRNVRKRLTRSPTPVDATTRRAVGLRPTVAAAAPAPAPAPTPGVACPGAL